MQIRYSPQFEIELINIIDFISLDKPSASINFASELEKLILEIPNFPLKYRKSLYFDNENIRDMTFKGYTIIYEINFYDDLIEIFTIFNRNKPIFRF